MGETFCTGSRYEYEYFINRGLIGSGVKEQGPWCQTILISCMSLGILTKSLHLSLPIYTMETITCTSWGCWVDEVSFSLWNHLEQRTLVSSFSLTHSTWVVCVSALVSLSCAIDLLPVGLTLDCELLENMDLVFLILLFFVSGMW